MHKNNEKHSSGGGEEEQHTSNNNAKVVLITWPWLTGRDDDRVCELTMALSQDMDARKWSLVKWRRQEETFGFTGRGCVTSNTTVAVDGSEMITKGARERAWIEEFFKVRRVCGNKNLFSWSSSSSSRAQEETFNGGGADGAPSHPCRVTNILYRHRCDHHRASYGAGGWLYR